jgi:murein DD-endopeptidase MepM/ murein hydrolase activator NlpD
VTKPKQQKVAPAVKHASAVYQRTLATGCPVASVVLLMPRRDPLLLGPFAASPVDRAQLARLVYRAGGGIVTGLAVTVSESACTSGGPVDARAHLQALSLFAGAVTADRIGLTRGKTVATTIVGLEVDGKRVAARAGRVAVQSFGYLVVGPAARVRMPSGGIVVGALAVHLVHAHAGFPAGTVVLVAAVGLPANKVKRLARKHARNPGAASREPLKVTPPLAFRHYVFPVADVSEYIDTYGAFRTDVPGNWHHGDDIFAALGTPVVAVASGTINRVGWEKLGGWRLWVRDRAGDEFYYAHLSGYAPTDLRSNRVRAGEVIGFVGNTGDAFTTSPHLHFEVHPRQLLHLGYDGAVDPTTYLDNWTHEEHVIAPRPVHPALPTQPQIRSEARYVFRELLAARHLVSHGPKPSARPHVSVPAGANGPVPTPLQAAQESAPPAAAAASGSPTTTYLLAALAGLVLASAVASAARVRRRRNRGRQPQSPTSAT